MQKEAESGCQFCIGGGHRVPGDMKENGACMDLTLTLGPQTVMRVAMFVTELRAFPWCFLGYECRRNIFKCYMEM